MEEDKQRNHRFFAVLGAILIVAFLVFLVVGIRACDEKATVTCPDGTQVEYSSHGSNYQSGADAIGKTLCK